MPSPPAFPYICADCRDEHWIRTPTGWRKCHCFETLLTDSFIKPIIRQGDAQLPAKWRKVEPWPLKDRLIIGGSYDEFRWQVWRSLLHYLQQRTLTYDYFDANRLCEIYFGRDGDEYKGVRELRKLDLLVLIVGVADLPNSYLPSLVHSVTRLRSMHGVPTWTYSTVKQLLKPRGDTELPAPQVGVVTTESGRPLTKGAQQRIEHAKHTKQLKGQQESE